MATGGDGYPNVYARGTTQDIMDQVLADYITANTPVSPAIQGRIVCADERGDGPELPGRDPVAHARAGRPARDRIRDGPVATPAVSHSPEDRRAAFGTRPCSIGRVTPQLEATLAGLPTRPGVYLMRDAAGPCSTSARPRTSGPASAPTGSARRRGPGPARSTGSAR